MTLSIRAADDTAFDLLALGECMLRLSAPAHQRLAHSPQLDVFVGGGEYNVAYAAARLGLRSAWIGGLNETPMSAIITAHARAVGLDISNAVTHLSDGVGRRDRIGLYFTEVGTGPRPSAVTYDRGHSVTAAIRPGEIDWHRLFVERGVRWFHSGGVYTALSDDARAVVLEAITAAHAAGTIVSYDLNYRSRLWSSADAIAATRPLLRYIDCLIGGREDFGNVLGCTLGETSTDTFDDTADCERIVREVVAEFPNIQVIGTALRSGEHASVNDWSGLVMAEGRFHRGMSMRGLQMEDRIGGGDGFAAGLIHGMLSGRSPLECVNLGIAHGALVMSTRGDSSLVTLDEVEHTARGGSARIQR